MNFINFSTVEIINYLESVSDSGNIDDRNAFRELRYRMEDITEDEVYSDSDSDEDYDGEIFSSWQPLFVLVTGYVFISYTSYYLS